MEATTGADAATNGTTAEAAGDGAEASAPATATATPDAAAAATEAAAAPVSDPTQPSAAKRPRVASEAEAGAVPAATPKVVKPKLVYDVEAVRDGQARVVPCPVCYSIPCPMLTCVDGDTALCLAYVYLQLPADVLAAFRYFDRDHSGYFKDRDLATIVLAGGDWLSLSQASGLVAPLAALDPSKRQRCFYKFLAPPTTAEPGEAET